MNILRSNSAVVALPAAVMLLACSLSFAQSAGDPPAIRCEFNSTERSLTVVYPELADGGGCRVIYEKPDEGVPTRVLWRASNDLNFCTKKLNVSVEKLQAGGWSCSQREDAAAYSGMLLAALPVLEGNEAPATPAASNLPTATPLPTSPAAAAPPVSSTPAELPAKAGMGSPDADRVLPRKDTADSIAGRQNTAEPQRQAAMAKAPTTSLAPKAPAPKPKAAAPLRTKTNQGEYDDWLFRWDDVGKQLVFTLYNSKDGTKVHNFTWVHEQMDESASSPSNIVLAQDEHANQVLIIAWPGKQSQHITVLDPLVKERPVCEIETLSTRDSDWGYGVEEKKLFLKGYKPSATNPAELVEFREQCTYVR